MIVFDIWYTTIDAFYKTHYLYFQALLVLFVAGVANAGLIGHGVVAVAHHGASSYQNHNQISVHPVPVAVAHAPIAVAHAPIALAHGPIGIGYGHGLH